MGAGLLGEAHASSVEQRGPVLVSGSQVAGEVDRQQVSQRAERDRLGGRVPDGPTGRSVGEAREHLLAEAGLAHAGRSGENDAADLLVAVPTGDPFELGRPSVSGHDERTSSSFAERMASRDRRRGLVSVAATMPMARHTYESTLGRRSKAISWEAGGLDRAR